MFYIYILCGFQQHKSHNKRHSLKPPFSKVFPSLNKFISKNKSLLTEVLTLGVEKVSFLLVFCCFCFCFLRERGRERYREIETSMRLSPNCVGKGVEKMAVCCFFVVVHLGLLY